MTFLYACNSTLPNLIWGEGTPAKWQVSDNHTDKIARHPLPFFPEFGVGEYGKRGTPKNLGSGNRHHTPPAFRDLLISIARSVYDKPEPPIRTLFAMPDPVPLKNPLGTVVDMDVNVDSS